MTIEYIALLISVFFFGNTFSAFAYEAFGIMGAVLVGTISVLALLKTISYGVKEGEFEMRK